MEKNIALVTVQLDTLAVLLSLRTSDADSIDKVIESLVGSRQTPVTDPQQIQLVPAKAALSDKYQVELLGEPLGARTLPQVLAKVLRLLSDYDTTLLHKLSMQRGNTRRYVAERPELVHIGRPDFVDYTLEFRPGWWIGTNYGRKEIKTILKAACSLCGIKYGTDLVLKNF